MNLQYISDNKGQTTGVFIPIKEWNELKNKYKGIEQEEVDVPKWKKNVVRKRIDNYNKNPKQGMDFNSTMDNIEKEL